MTPNQWATNGIRNLYKWEGDRIVAETNQGWDMVKAVIRNIEPTVRVIDVVAKKNKFARAEPVVGLYERGQVHHVGRLDKLEDQMTSWDSREAKESPGRIDALVYAITELMGKGKTGFILR